MVMVSSECASVVSVMRGSYGAHSLQCPQQQGRAIMHPVFSWLAAATLQAAIRSVLADDDARRALAASYAAFVRAGLDRASRLARQAVSAATCESER